MTTVAVTGASGYLGRLLVERLEDDADISRIVGVDIADPSFSGRNLEFYRMDVRSPQIGRVIEACDIVVHLAAARGDPEETRDVNIGGTRSIADACARAGVSKLVYASTFEVYGAHPDNDFPLTESSPLRPARESAHATSKAEAETVVSYYEKAHPEATVTTLRLAWVCGPTIPTRSAAAVDARLRVAIRGYEPPLQALHEHDAAGALALAVRGTLPGVYNVASSGTVDDPAAVLGQRVLTIEPARAARLLDRAHRLGIGVPSAEMATLMYPQVMSCERLASAGFSAGHSTGDALASAAASRRDWVALGKVRFRPKRLAMVAGTLGAVLATGAVGKRRARRERGRASES